MPSRVFAVKAILCATTSSSGSRPKLSGTGSRPRTVVAHSSHGIHVANLPFSAGLIRRTCSSLSILDKPFLRTRRHHHYKSIPMDATLAKIFSANAQWTEAVNAAEPGFFEKSAKSQTPKVSCRSLWLPIVIISPFAFVSTHAGALARMFRCPRPRKCHHCLAPRRHVRPSQRRQVSYAHLPSSIPQSPF